jgi:hypothetical protein
MRSLLLSLALAFLIPSTGYSWTIEKVSQDPKFPGTLTVTVDPFGLMATNQLDVVFVIDNSGSMSPHQKNLANHINTLIAPLLAADLDVHAGVISTDVDGFRSPTGGVMNNGFVTSTTPNMAAALATNMILGVNGSGNEKHFASLMMALSPALLNGANAGFLRDGAALAVIFLTDAEDQSIETPDQVIQFLKDLKGGDMNLLRMGAIYVPTGTSNCDRDEMSKMPTRLEQVFGAFTATTMSLCEVNFKDGIEKLGSAMRPATLGEPIRSVQLPMTPAFETISVKFGGDTLRAGDLSEGWIYERTTNSVKVGPDYDFMAHPRDTKLVINYVPKDWQ